MSEEHEGGIDKRMEELRQLILGQVRDLYDAIANIRQELREVRARSEKLESHNRRL